MMEIPLYMYIITVFCVFFPIFHMVNAYLFSKKTPYYMITKPKTEQGISVLIPCYNEESIIQTAIEGMLSMNYQNYEVVFINDGSNDETMTQLIERLQLIPADISPGGEIRHMPVSGIYQSPIYPKIKVLDKVNGGKADALNAGISYASHGIIITLDADSVLKADSLKVINSVFGNEEIIAAGGMVHVLQGRNMVHPTQSPGLSDIKQIVRFQILEYLRGFFTYKASLAKADALSIISGAFGIFRREVLLEVGGYRKTVGEDIDITLKVQQYRLKHKGKKVLFVPEAICYTEVPENYSDLFKQRVRWQKAFTDCLIIYGKAIFMTLFTRKVSFFMIFDAFMAGVLLSFFTVYFIVSHLFFYPLEQTYPTLLFFLSGAIGSNLLYILVSLKLSSQYGNTFSDKDMGYLAWTILLDLLVFRFLTLFYTVFGTIAYFGRKNNWNKVTRTGKKYVLVQSAVTQKADL